jgi:hypothetical protein
MLAELILSSSSAKKMDGDRTADHKECRKNPLVYNKPLSKSSKNSLLHMGFPLKGWLNQPLLLDKIKSCI